MANTTGCSIVSRSEGWGLHQALAHNQLVVHIRAELSMPAIMQLI